MFTHHQCLTCYRAAASWHSSFGRSFQLFLTACLVAMTSVCSAQQPVVVQPLPPVLQVGGLIPTPEGLPAVPPHGALTLTDLEQMGLVANPSVARAAALVGAARGQWVQVGLLPNPTVGYLGQQLGSGGLAEQHGVQFSQDFVRGGKLRLSRAVAEQQIAKAEQELVAQQQRVITDVRIGFYQVLLAQRQIELTDNLTLISRQGANTVDGLFRAKEASRSDVLQAQLELENSQILVQNSRYRYDAAWRSLTVVVGHPELLPQPLAGDAFAAPREFNYQDSLRRLLTASPEVAIAMTEIDLARTTLARARVEPIPNISFQGLVNPVDNGIFGRSDGGVSLSMPIPILNKNQGAILRAQQEIVAAERAMQQLEFDLQNRLAPTFERYASARNQVERYRSTILPAAQESLNLVRQTYQAGEANFLNLLTAQRTFSQMNLNYLQALQSLRVSEAEIEGLLLSGSLSRQQALP